MPWASSDFLATPPIVNPARPVSTCDPNDAFDAFFALCVLTLPKGVFVFNPMETASYSVRLWVTLPRNRLLAFLLTDMLFDAKGWAAALKVLAVVSLSCTKELLAIVWFTDPPPKL